MQIITLTRVARAASRIQTERMRSAKSYVLADGNGAASSPHTGISALPYWQLGLMYKSHKSGKSSNLATTIAQPWREARAGKNPAECPSAEAAKRCRRMLS
jgi:hypothetical protein